MIVGVLKEIKDNENRVSLTPEGARVLVQDGNRVVIESGAGTGSGISDEAFSAAGAVTAGSAEEVCNQAELVLKIKEPLPVEYTRFRPDQLLFTFFHFASSKELTAAMMKQGVTCIAYETVQEDDGRVPLLAPMSEVAGKMASLVAANYLARPVGGKGVLASAVGQVKPAVFVILGGGNAGRAAAGIALAIGAEVYIIEHDERQRERLSNLFPGARVLSPDPETIANRVSKADAVVGTVHVPGRRAPKLVTRDMVAAMEDGSVVVDVAIDQGGCFETSRPTSHSEPIYVEEGVIHYCVTNMPGIFPRTATAALTSVTLPYVRLLARDGEAAFENQALLHGLNIYRGKVTNRSVAEAHGLEYTDARELLPGL